MGSSSQGRRGWPERLAASQYDVISRDQAIGCGLTLRALQYRIRPGGPWQRLLPGVYLTVTGAPTPNQLLMAALVYAGDGSIITGLAALQRYTVKVPASRVIDVLIPAARHRASRGFVVTQRTTRMPRRFMAEGPIQFAPPARAVADAARGLTCLPEVRAVVAGAVQKGWCTVPELAAELASGPHRGAGRLRIVLDEVSSGIRSAAEGDFADLVGRSDLPAPLLNPRLYLGQHLLAVPDAWWPHAGVAVEVDSQEWHLLPADWERTMRRHARLTAAGVLVLHFSPRQIKAEPGDVITSIWAALRAGRPVASITTRPARG